MRFPTPMAMPIAITKMEYARAYVLDQPYTGVVCPKDALKKATVFPFLLKSYLPGLKMAEEGKTPWKI